VGHLSPVDRLDAACHVLELPGLEAGIERSGRGERIDCDAGRSRNRAAAFLGEATVGHRERLDVIEEHAVASVGRAIGAEYQLRRHPIQRCLYARPAFTCAIRGERRW
jgi:hypothetical protein